MKCLDARQALDPWLDGELAGEERAALEIHLARCGDCTREIDERRGLGADIRDALRRSLDGVEPPPGVRLRLVDRMVEISRARFHMPARVAAAAVVVVALGLVAYALGWARATPQQVVVATRIGEREAREAQIRRLREDARQDLRFVRDALDGEREDAAAAALAVAASHVERALDPSVAAPPPPAAPAGRLAVSGVVNGVTVEIVQSADGRVRLAIPGRTLEAPSMGELLRRHGDVCRAYAVDGGEGHVRVGDQAAAVDLRGRLDLLWRTGRWEDGVQWEAARAWMEAVVPDAAEAEKRLKELQERVRRAAEAVPAPPVAPDVRSALKHVKTMTREELEEARVRVEQEMRRLEEQFKEMQEWRGRARGLRAYAEGVRRR